MAGKMAIAIDFIALTAWPHFWAFLRSKGVKKNKAYFISLANFLAISCAYAEGLCKERETAIFNCELQKSTSSMCESNDTGVLFYRNGVVNQIDLEFSDNGARKGKIFYFSNAPYAGGGEAHIRFSRSGYTYYLYDKTVRTGEGPTFSAGVVVYKRTQKISNLICGNDASIHQNAYHSITKERYRSIGYK
jgi:hypothetical protein